MLHFILGRCQRPGPGDSQHLQRASSVPHLLADIRHHGRPDVCRKILQGELSLPLKYCLHTWRHVSLDKAFDILVKEALLRLVALAFGFKKLDAD